MHSAGAVMTSGTQYSLWATLRKCACMLASIGATSTNPMTARMGARVNTTPCAVAELRCDEFNIWRFLALHYHHDGNKLHDKSKPYRRDHPGHAADRRQRTADDGDRLTGSGPST